MANKTLNAAKAAKNDEFYTRMNDIANELYHYRHHFVGKKIFLNCDDPRTSNFWQYFELNFDELKLEKLTSTHYDPDEPTYKLEMTRGVDVNGDGVMDEYDIVQTPLLGNGDFRSAECIELLEEADIVITNPPFSLWREYIAQLIEHDKKFIILGNPNATKYKEVFPLFQENKIWIGYKSMGTDMYFIVPDEYKKWLLENKKEGSGYKIIDGEVLGRVQAIWYTNLDIDKRHNKMTLWKDYYEEPDDYPRYVNYDAIEVSKVNEIPRDYVPCWFECPYADQCEYGKSEGDDTLAALCETAGGGGVSRRRSAPARWAFRSPSSTTTRRISSRYWAAARR